MSIMEFKRKAISVKSGVAVMLLVYLLVILQEMKRVIILNLC